jgi:hypothetical protein
MKFKAILTALAVCLAAAAVCFAADAFTGTWKLNEAKSKFPPGSTKNHTVVYEAAGENTKVTVDGTGPDGKASHSEWTGKFDGKEYAVTGDSPDTMRSVKKVNDHTLELTGKKDGKVVLSGKIVVSADGETRTVTITGTAPDGKKSTSTAVYDKQ